MADSLADQLLHASLLCGMKPGGCPAYRLQLFSVANRDLGSRSHQSDFQRALQTGVDRKGLWDNYDDKGSGEYVITCLGYRTAKEKFPYVVPCYRPVRAMEYQCCLTWHIDGIEVTIKTRGTHSRVFLNGKLCRSAKDACRRLEEQTAVSLPTAGESAVRVLYNMAIDREFEMHYKD